MEKARTPEASPFGDYKTGTQADKAGGRLPGSPADLPAVEEWLRLLARAVQQYHTYPATSPLCTEAISACHQAFAALDRDRVPLRVTPSELVVDEVGVGAGTIVERQLARRLHRAHVVAIDIDRGVTLRQLSRFCSDLLHCDGAARDQPTLAEVLAEHGVDTIVALMAYRPEVLDVGAPVPARRTLVEHEQKRRQQAFASGGPVEYLYPRDKGWVRLDPAARLDTVSLTDLAVLVDNPAEVATILLRLTDDPVGSDAGATALERKYTDVTNLFAALDPALARTMFARLAHAVLALEPERRKRLLQRTILPGLLDGQADGTVLRDFPDDDLAEALCLLLELETAAPEVLTAALARLELPDERRDTVLPLIDSRLRKGEGGDAQHATEGERGLDRLARRLVRVETAPGKDFSEFSAFDLSIDAAAGAAIAAVRDTIAATDTCVTSLECLSSLVRLQPNTRVVESLLRRAVRLLANLFEREDWSALLPWVAAFRELADDLRDQRPDVADTIGEVLAAFLAPSRVSALLKLHQDEAGRQMANDLVRAFGASAAPGLIAWLDGPASRTGPAVALMCEHAGLLAPALVPELAGAAPAKRRALIRILGYAGAGFEAPIASQFELDDEQTSREATRALARIGTGQAAALVGRQLQTGTGLVRAAAEESLWHFPPARLAWQLRQLLGSRDFVLQHPKTTARLLDRAVQSRTRGLDEVLNDLERLRFRFWNPGLIRVALKARELRAR